MLTSLYIHIPFCSHICKYCDFHKEMAKPDKKQRYIKALIKEFTHYQDKYSNLRTIYIGGGTPSSLDYSLLEELLLAIRTHINLQEVEEYTIETNPNDITEDFITLIQEYGVNRISIGVQSFHQKHLDYIGRTHSKEDVLNAISLLRKANFPNISIDMMFSLIDQTMDELKEDVEETLRLDVDHISYYSLILEEKSVLYHLLQKSDQELSEEELEGDMYNLVIDTLKENGYQHYEISNFCKPGRESKHNITYWTMKDYLGLGSGSHSMYDNSRFYHPTNIWEYIHAMEADNYDILERYEYSGISEDMMLSLRLLKGVSIEEINQKYQVDIFEKFPELNQFIQDGLLETSNKYLRFTRKGLLLGNLVFQIFVEVL